MKLMSALLAPLLFTLASTSISQSCQTPPNGDTSSCVGQPSATISDKVLFSSNSILDGFGSPTPGASPDPAVKGVDYGGDNLNILANTGDFVNWFHNFTFSPPVQTNGILKASLTVSLVDFAGNICSPTDRSADRDYHHDDRDYEKDSDGGVTRDSEGNIVRRNKKHKEDDSEDREEYRYDFEYKVGAPTSGSSAKIWLEGNDTNSWIGIPYIHDTTQKKFQVSLSQLYDGSFGVKLKSTLNDFEIQWSRLDIEYCPDTSVPSNEVPVPEPSTILLLGAGLMGAGLLRNKSGR